MTILLDTLEPGWKWLLQVSGQAAILVILILLVQALIGDKITPAWKHALWLLLVLRLALPIQIPSRFSLFNLTQLRPKAAPAEQVKTTTSKEAASTEATVAGAAELSAATTPARPSATAPNQRSLGEQPWDSKSVVAQGWEKWLSLLWLAGAAMLVLRITVQNLLFSWRLRQAPTVTDTQAWQTLEDCRKLMGVRQRLVLVETEMVHSPALYGFLRLHLLLPKNSLAVLSAEELRFVLLHELAHVKRKDMVVNWVVMVLQVLHWFNPLVWLGFRRMAGDREMAADALALSYLQPRENVAYGSAILKLLQTLMRPAPLPGLVGILEDNNQMKRRITMIAKFRKTSRWPIPATLAFISLALVALTDPSTGADREPVKLSGKPAADLAVLRVWNCTGGELSSDAVSSFDGRYLSYRDPEMGGLMVRDLIKGKSEHVVKASERWKEFVTASAMSPDGSQIVYGWFGKNGGIQLRLVERDGKRDRVLYQHPVAVWAQPACWSANGEQIVADFQMVSGSGSNQLALISVRDGSIRVVKALAWAFPGGVALDPSGRFLAYHIQRSSASPEREIRLINLQNDEETLPLGGPSDNVCLGWSPDGSQLLFTSNRRSTIDCWAQRLKDGKPQGAPELLKQDLGPVTPMGITRAGGLYYRRDASAKEVHIAKLDLDLKEFVSQPKPLTRKFQGHEAEPQWSPNGTQLAYLSRGMLCVRPTDTGEDREYPLKIGNFHSPAWSADGKSIRVTTSHENEQPGTFRVDLATGEAQRLEQHGFFLFPVADETVGFQRVMQLPQQILSRNLRSGEEKVLYKLAQGEFFAGGWMLSPNAQYLAFGTVQEEGTGWKGMVKCIAAAGGEPRELMSSTNGFSGLTWFPDSQRVLARCGEQLCAIPIDGQPLRKMKVPADASEFSIHPSGQQVAFVAKTTRVELWLMENAFPALVKGRETVTQP